MKITFKKLSDEEVLNHIDEIMNVYASVYSLPPYSETRSFMNQVRQSWPEKTKKEGFAFFVALDAEQTIRGFSFGWLSVAGGKFNQRIREHMHENSYEWLEDCFEWVDLAVDPKFQGQGMGKGLVEKTLNHVTQKTILLQTSQEDTVASKIYKKLGFSVVIEELFISTEKTFRVFGKKLN